MAKRSIYVAPKVFPIEQLDASRCHPVAVSDKKGFIKKVVENSMQIHHSFRCPDEYNEKNEFNVLFPQMKSSAINRKAKLDGSSTYHLHGEIYMNYHLHRDTTERKIDIILANNRDQTAQGLRATLQRTMLQEYGRTQQQIDDACTNVLPMGEETLTLDYFRTICFVLLIEDELRKDEVGTRIMEFTKRVKKIYADYLDKHLPMKGAIFEAIGIPKTDAGKPAIDYIEDVAHWNKYDDRHPKQNQIDYSKSPSISTKLFTKFVDLGDVKSTDFVVWRGASQAQVMCSYIYNQVDSRTPQEKVHRCEELDTFIYMAGDTAKGKPHFKLSQRMTTKAMTAWWSGATKRCVIQFTVAVTKIFNRLITPSQTRQISSDEYANDLADARAAALMMVPEVGETQAEAGAGGGGGDDSDYDEYGEPRKRSLEEDVAAGLELQMASVTEIRYLPD